LGFENFHMTSEEFGVTNEGDIADKSARKVYGEHTQTQEVWRKRNFKIAIGGLYAMHDITMKRIVEVQNEQNISSHI
jgi:hypothetical protein